MERKEALTLDARVKARLRLDEASPCFLRLAAFTLQRKECARVKNLLIPSQQPLAVAKSYVVQ
jgi:hypothetical protein